MENIELIQWGRFLEIEMKSKKTFLEGFLLASVLKQRERERNLVHVRWPLFVEIEFIVRVVIFCGDSIDDILLLFNIYDFFFFLSMNFDFWIFAWVHLCFFLLFCHKWWIHRFEVIQFTLKNIITILFFLFLCEINSRYRFFIFWLIRLKD